MYSWTQKPMPAENLEGKINNRKKKKKKLRLRRRLIPVFLLLLLAYMVFVFLGLRLQLHSINEEIAVLEKRKISLEQEYQSLLAQKEMMSSPAYVEKRAREALGLIKPGEKILLPAKPGEVLPLVQEGREEIAD
ncbi:MAG: septum formation initiator family protein [Bacillota bacterium]|jgi:cell division protein FtsL